MDSLSSLFLAFKRRHWNNINSLVQLSIAGLPHSTPLRPAIQNSSSQKSSWSSAFRLFQTRFFLYFDTTWQLPLGPFFQWDDEMLSIYAYVSNEHQWLQKPRLIDFLINGEHKNEFHNWAARWCNPFFTAHVLFSMIRFCGLIRTFQFSAKIFTVCG